MGNESVYVSEIKCFRNIGDIKFLKIKSLWRDSVDIP